MKKNIIDTNYCNSFYIYFHRDIVSSDTDEDLYKHDEKR